MPDQWFQSLISAGAGLTGVFVGGGLTWLREARREKSLRQQNARYLAIRTVCVLDEYMSRCANVAADSGSPDQNGYYYSDEVVPVLEFPADVDWKAVSHDLAYKVLSLKNTIENSQRAIEAVGEHSFPPDYDDYFEERQFRYACLGVEVAGITDRLRAKYAIPPRVIEGWHPLAYLQEKKAKILEQRRLNALKPSLLD